MARAMHYSPVIRRFLVKVLYHEARHRRKPMTELQETRLLRLIKNHVEGLTRRDIVPSRGFHCSGCEFFDECRNWG